MLLLVGPYALLAVLAVAARQLGWKAAGAAKALPVSYLIASLALAAATGRAEAGAVYYLIMAGLACGLAGDVLLLDKGRFFKRGVVAFLAGHVLYIVAFAFSGLKPTWRMLLPIVGYFGIYAIVLSNVLLAKHAKYRPLAVAYLGGILAMTVSALFADAANAARGASSYFFEGAFLFTVSDGVLSYRVFQRRFRFVDVAVLSTYYAAQCVIAANALFLAS